MALMDIIGRTSMIGLVGFSIVANVACKGGEETETETEDSSDTTPPPPSFFEPSWVGFTAVFAYDASSDAAVGYMVEGQNQDPFLEIGVYNEDGGTTQDDEVDACFVGIQTAGPLPLAGWTSDVGSWFGFDFPTTAPFVTNCDDADHPLDQDVWGTTFAATLAGHGWGASVGPLESDLRTEFQNQVGADWATEYAPYVHGGGIRVPRFASEPELPNGFFDFSYGYGFALDESFAPVPGDDGNGVRLYVPGSTENPGDAIGTGLYQVYSAGGVYVEFLVP
jgi:hypothetical protein